MSSMSFDGKDDKSILIKYDFFRTPSSVEITSFIADEAKNIKVITEEALVEFLWSKYFNEEGL